MYQNNHVKYDAAADAKAYYLSQTSPQSATMVSLPATAKAYPFSTHSLLSQTASSVDAASPLGVTPFPAFSADKPLLLVVLLMLSPALTRVALMTEKRSDRFLPMESFK